MDPGNIFDAISKHDDDEVVILSGPKIKEPSMTLLTRSANDAPTAPTRITTRSVAKVNPNA